MARDGEERRWWGAARGWGGGGSHGAPAQGLGLGLGLGRQTLQTEETRHHAYCFTGSFTCWAGSGLQVAGPGATKAMAGAEERGCL